MTRKLYWEDAYLKEFEAVVKTVEGSRIVLDQTAFYPTSGGQLNDMGKIFVEGGEYNVIDVKEEGGEVVHTLDREFGSGPESKINGVVDWERRYSLMRYHTALHVVCAVVESRHGGGWKGGMIYVDKAHVDFDLPILNKELAEKVMEEANAVINEGHRVLSRFITQQEALANPSLAKTEPGRELIKRLGTVRVVEIENFDIQMDGGTHVLDTKEIGRLRLVGFDNKGSHRKRVEMQLE
ncbi:MAG TPA: alanyl-tRNA editing protein [Candidatus Saccharimonadales bacterium]|nr:alanyl-tRNA editing protein [Candidatus Saccharimonadales bacterium]